MFAYLFISTLWNPKNPLHNKKEYIKNRVDRHAYELMCVLFTTGAIALYLLFFGIMLYYIPIPSYFVIPIWIFIEGASAVYAIVQIAQLEENRRVLNKIKE